MKYELWYSVVVRDRQGKVLSRERRRSRSFLKQWNQLICAQMTDGPIEIVRTNGTPYANAVQDRYNFRMNAGAGETDYGIRVGTGNTPVAIDDYALEAPIEEGTGAGQMEHLLTTKADFVVAPPSCYFSLSRVIVNNSPAEITVKEAGIYMRMLTSLYCCGIRDIFSVPQAVPVGGAITIDWTIQVTA